MNRNVLSTIATRLQNNQPAMMEKLKKATSEGNWSEAIFWQERLIEWNKRSTGNALPHEYVYLANLLHMTGEYEREAEVMQQVVDKETGFNLNPLHVTQLANAYISAGRPGRAKTVWNLAFLSAFEHFNLVRQQTADTNVILVLPEKDTAARDEKEELVICLWLREVVSKTDNKKIEALKNKGYIDKTKELSPLLKKIEESRMLNLAIQYGAMLKKNPQLLNDSQQPSTKTDDKEDF